MRQANPTVNFGLGNPLAIVGAAGAERASLLKFDLSLLPATPLPTLVVLSIYCSVYASALVPNVYRVFRVWVEDQATWNVYSTGNNWGTAGCKNTTTDRSSTSMGSATIAAGWVNFTLGLTEFASLRASNNGMIIMDASGTAGTNLFYARDAADPANAPKLTVTLPGGQILIF